ncbi:LOW QUALITY PROTEIN: U3 small nucleolar RNA-associated protein [Colletotrichum tofieldiae]|nr:LOW QUALITY PROTEIN: U3 small nucleolar RNA-associated protein [Colletotrichum tofieldiae]
MASKQPFKTTFEPERVIRPIFTGGSVALDNGAKILATPLGEDAILTNPSNGKHLAKIEGIYALKTTEDGTIEAKLTRSLKPHGTPVVVLAVDRTSTLLATGGTDGAIKVWDIAGGYVTHTFRGPSVLVSALHFFEVAARSSEGEVEKAGKKGKKSKQAEEEVTATTNWRLVSGSQDGKVRVWDLHKRVVIANLDSHVSNVQGLDYSPEQHAIVSASRDKTIIWWDAKSWKIRKVVPCLELVEAVGFIDGGRLTYSAGAKGCLRIWDTDTGRELTKDQHAKAEAESIVSAVSHPELPFILCVQVDHTLALYRVPEKDATEGVMLEPFRRISGTHDSIIDLNYLLPDRSLLALATNAEDIRIVSVKDSESTYFGQDLALLKGHDDIIVSLDVDWSGYWIATGAKDNTARLWRVDPANNSFTCYATFTGHTESVGAVTLPKQTPQESSAQFKDPLNHPPPFLFTGSQDQTVKKWEIPREVQSRKGGSRAVFTRKAHDKDINAMDVHPTSQLFASSSQDKMVKIWSVAEGEVQGILRGHRRGVWSVKFAPPAARRSKVTRVAGKGVVLTGSADKTVKIWSLNDYTCIRTFEGHSNSVLKVVWLNMPKPEGKGKKQVQFASAGSDGLVKVWDANSGETETTLDNHEDRIWALAVNSADNTIVSGDGDSIVTFWKDTTSESQAAATEAAQKLIEQEQELENHIHHGSYRDAIVLALQLNHPGRLLSLFTSVVTSAPEPGSLCGLKAVDQVLATLSDEQIFTLLLRLRDWNTNARTATVAQRILWTLARSYPASKFSNLSIKGARGQKSLKEVLNALKVYTERHYRRTDELVDESYLVEYTLREMDSLAPAIEDVVMGNAAEAEGMPSWRDVVDNCKRQSML